MKPECPVCGSKKRLSELEAENQALKAKLAKFEGSGAEEKTRLVERKEVAALEQCWGSAISLVPFQADSPYFEKQVAEKMEACSALSSHLSRILDASKKWKKKSRDLWEAETAFAEALKDASPANKTGIDLFTLTAAQFGSILQGMSEARQVSVHLLESTFTECVETFNNVEVEQTRELHKMMGKAFNDYTSAVSQFLNTKKPAKHKSLSAQNTFMISLAQKESDAIVAFEQYELCRLDLTRQLNRLEIKRQNELAEAVVRGIFAVQNGIHQNHDNMMKLLPECKALQKVFPSIHNFLGQIDTSFGQLRFELCRTLCRSVKLSSSRLDSSPNGAEGEDGGTIFHARKDSGPDIAADGGQDLQEGNAESGSPFMNKGFHGRATSTSMEFMRRLAHLGHSSSPSQTANNGNNFGLHGAQNGNPMSPPLPNGSTAPSQSLKRSGQLNTADSFLLLKKSPPLVEILRDSKELNAFLRFVIAENNAYHIAFWLDVERFRSISESHSRNIRAQAIFEKYVVAEDTMLLLSHGRKSQLTKAYEECLSRQGGGVPKTFFDQAQSEVLDIISADTYTRFLRSDEWLNCQVDQTPPVAYDPRLPEQVIEPRHLQALRLIGLDTADSGLVEDQVARSIVDTNSRVIIHGPFDSSCSDAFNLEYPCSKALSLLEKDLSGIYQSAAKTACEMDALRQKATAASSTLIALSPLYKPTSSVATTLTCGTSVAKPVSQPSVQSDMEDGSGAIGISYSSPSATESESFVPVVSGHPPLPPCPPPRGGGGKANPASSAPKHASSMLKSRIRTWASKRFSKVESPPLETSGATASATCSDNNQTSPSQVGSPTSLYGAAVCEAASLGRYLSGEISPTHHKPSNAESEEAPDKTHVEATAVVEEKESPPVVVNLQQHHSTTALDNNGDMMIVKEGYLRKRSSKMRKTWKRRWFILRANRLYYVRDFNDFHQPELVCECMLATVREADPATVHEMQFCFELLSPNRRTYIMQAESEAAMRSWVDAIRTCTEKMITGLSHEPTPKPCGEANETNADNVSRQGRGLKSSGQSAYCSASSCSSSVSAGTTGSHSTTCSSDKACQDCNHLPCVCFVEPGKLSSDEELKAIQEDNPTCAECGSPQPDWAIINLGVLVCIECSGIHRSLGVHISKVRSMTLDTWSGSSKALLRVLGNQVTNSIWESDISSQTGWNKPLPSAPRTVKERFIKAKYLWKGFIGENSTQARHPEHGPQALGLGGFCTCSEDTEALFLESISRGDAAQVMWYVVHGALEKYGKEFTSEPLDTTPLHEAAKNASLGVCEILLQNGARSLLKTIDKQGRTPLDVATSADIRSLFSSCA